MITDAIRVIFFDAVGTLIHPEPQAIDVYAAVGQRFGSHRDAAEVRHRFCAAFQREEDYDRQHGYRTDNEREVRRWRNIVATVLDDVTDPEGCFQALFAHFARPDAWRCAPDTELVLPELLARGYRLGLASNFDKRLHAVADALPDLRPLSCRVVSAEVGWRKPHPRFFEKVCDAAGAPARQILFVGDDFANDYEGAQAAGLAAALYDPLGKRCDRAAVRVGSLRELLELVSAAPPTSSGSARRA